MAQNNNLAPVDVLQILIVPVCNQMNVNEEDIRRIAVLALRNLTPLGHDFLISLTDRINSHSEELQRLSNDSLENAIYYGCEFTNLTKWDIPFSPNV
ncbi:21076_t:CDS:2 [Cetraspora pellucida]|uniref:21076_t:CDS:1 n=1 Tax=Cetraspora pellucida TaxID=1433469 RepID=A0A9N9HW17_9GLOM|nr:21076_t:CDS:2 [Cetraspora pellucida]